LTKGHADDRLNVKLEKNVWDVEYGKGDWSYLATNPVERARLGVIYSSFYQPMANRQHLLDVGCGEGGLSDLFPRYVRGPARWLVAATSLQQTRHSPHIPQAQRTVLPWLRRQWRCHRRGPAETAGFRLSALQRGGLPSQRDGHQI